MQKISYAEKVKLLSKICNKICTLPIDIQKYIGTYYNNKYDNKYVKLLKKSSQNKIPKKVLVKKEINVPEMYVNNYNFKEQLNIIKSYPLAGDKSLKNKKKYSKKKCNRKNNKKNNKKYIVEDRKLKEYNNNYESCFDNPVLIDYGYWSDGYYEYYHDYRHHNHCPNPECC
jgi:hypothetical protein